MAGETSPVGASTRLVRPEWACEVSVGRPRPEQPDGVRNAFQRDRDRIIHAKAFRRLMHKTQVFISPDGDHFRTRLTHTLELAQISRTIARSLGLNEDLTEAISLGHDLGHTPFGHTGEGALTRVLSAHGRAFRHNEHSLRVVDVLEKDHQGLNLTHEVRDGIRNHTGKGYPLTREGEVVRISDRIAYVNHDVDDAIRAGVIRFDDLPKGPIAVLGDHMSERIDTLVRDMIVTSNEKGEIGLSDKVYEALMELRTWLFKNVYNNPRSRENEKAGGVVAALFEYYLERSDERAESDPDPITESVDFVAGMTDRYALATYRQSSCRAATPLRSQSDLRGTHLNPDKIIYRVGLSVRNEELNELFDAAWPEHSWRNYRAGLGSQSRYVCVYHEHRLVGFVNLAWDGARTLFSSTQRSIRSAPRGIGKRLEPVW
jgi:dGTPase